ncbi:MAG: UvrD-helicase domain-containing protein [Parasutterella sp.]
MNRCKEEGKRASEVYSKFSKDKAYIQIYAMYEAVLQREGACDFAELLLRAYELFEPQRNDSSSLSGTFSFYLG